ncbi:N-acyl homoserine lactonase family protein [Saccharopolyspora sp. K220]|uniref:N-acyl homoserine lactonase family protein n=1 Tax=Saccharopolyspora soli TaxID=2926618 RepID=UPI001F587868|nr:N-acyl homoserine lactonase family protein [Saccharopolyspora soli]MCI2417877.1 N-acyl homoserine lactonase family protein [Saccharopolyspora soli]
MGLTITPLLVGWIKGMPKPAITYGFGWGELHDSAMLVFLIEGGDSPVIVDTGTLGPEWTMEHHGYTLSRPLDLEPSTVLSEAGVEIGDVRHVINTHLHWDHCSNNALFTGANFYIQGAELAYAADPLPVHRAAYEKKRGIKPPWLEVWDRIETVHGDAEILPGISVVSVPGHTPGSQGVVVETDAGRYLLAGDLIDTYENWTGNESVEHIPSGVHTDLFQYFDSFKRVEGLGCEIVPSHDAEVLKQGPFGTT